MKERIWITEREAVSKIYGTAGKMFKAIVRKRTNGEFRRMICRLGVKKGVTGRGMAYDPKEYNLITVWDGSVSDEEKGLLKFRHIAVDGLLMLKIGGVTYYVSHEEAK